MESEFLNQHEDYSGPEMIHTEAIGMGTNGTTASFRIVRVYEEAATCEVLNLEQVPKHISL